MDNTAVMDDMVTVNLTREQYADLLDSLDAVARDVDEWTRLEGAVNFFRDRGRLEVTLAEVLLELRHVSLTGANWRRQAQLKRQDLTGLISHIRKQL